MKLEAIGNLVGLVRQCDPATLGRGWINYLDISSIDRESKRIVAAERIVASGAPSRARQLVRSNDVLISTVRPNLNAVALVPPHFDGDIASTGFCVLRPSEDQVCPGYLFYFTQTSRFVSHLTKISTGASYPAVTDSDVLETNIPLPSLAEQQRITAQLDVADRLRHARRYALELSDKFLAAAFLKLFGDPKVNPERWPTQCLSDACLKFSDGPFGSNLKSEHYRPAGVRVVRLNNIGVGEFLDDDQAFISLDHFATLRKHECLPGDVLIGTLGDPNLRACILPPKIKVALNKADCVQARTDPRKATPEYLSGLLNIPSTLNLVPGMAHGQTRTRVSMGELAELPIPVPPLSKQQQFAVLVAHHERLRATEREGLRQAEHLFQGLLQRAFSKVTQC